MNKLDTQRVKPINFHPLCYSDRFKAKYSLESMFMSLVFVEDLDGVTKDSKNNTSPGIDSISYLWLN